MSTTMTPEQREDAEMNAREFFDKLAPSDKLPDPRDPASIEQYTQRLGEISQTSFSDAVSTLASTVDKSTAESLQAAGDRRNLGSYVIKAFQKKICGNPEVTEEVKKALAAAEKQGGVQITTPTATGITTGVATLVSISILTAFSGPVAVVVAPLAAGVALLVMQCGLDGFCAWSAGDRTERRSG